MKKVTMNVFFVAFCLLDLIYLAMTADSFYQEYVLDKFVYWGYPQWGWMYADPKVYLWFNIVYLLFLVVLPAASVWLRRRFCKTSLILSALPLMSAAVFAYMPSYNWNRQFEIFEAERTIENSRIPAGRWWASAEQMQRYDDNSAWEKFKGYFGRGEWPGGYPIWGDYRVWLLPDFATDTLGRRGMVFHGGNKISSPWGIDMGDDIIDFAIRLRRNGGPMSIEVSYDDTETEGGAEVDVKTEE